MHSFVYLIISVRQLTAMTR